MQILEKNCGFTNDSGSLICAALDKNFQHLQICNLFFCLSPAANGFIIPISTFIFRKVIANPAVMYVLPTSVSVPVINNDFNILSNHTSFIN